MDVTPNPIPAPISLQPTLSGRQLHVAQDSLPDGRLLLPYGDYGANTGPINVIAFDPVTNTVETLLESLTDERIQDYRRFDDGRLWSCDTDPQGREEAVVARSGATGSNSWERVTISVPGKGVAVHQFDVAPSNGAVYATVARNYTDDEMTERAATANPEVEYNTAFAVWKSIDDGVTWTEDLAVLKDGDGYYRPYGFGRCGDDLFVADPNDGGYWQLHNGTWSSKRTNVLLSIYAPPIWSFDRQEFATSNNNNAVFKLNDEGALVSYTPYPHFQRAIASGPDGWLWFSTNGVLNYGNTVYGSVENSSNCRGVVTAENRVYISDGSYIYEVTQGA